MTKRTMTVLGLILCLGISQVRAEYYVYGGVSDLGDDEVVSTDWIWVYNGSDGTPAEVTFWANVFASGLEVHGSSTATLRDGPVIDILYAADYSTINVYHASSFCLFADYSSVINVYGGDSHGFISAWGMGTVNIYGSSFEIDDLGTAEEDWAPAPPSVDASMPEFQLRGTLADGTALDAMCSVLDAGVMNLLPPEPIEPLVLEVAIDIKPGSTANTVNLRSNGVTPAAILSSDTFDATTVDPATISLAGATVAMRGKAGKYMAAPEDINADGLLDLVVHVQTSEINPAMFEDDCAILVGATFDDQAIQGSDQITIVPRK
ncbi:MAG: hypothetical protein A2Y76_05600 [Planctomycetes bacterium RBG_13_60_9]|nr:MAG: hypothetical protein A2Y76_05600 [Planctomycetes bacterium RBG_13_60_9]